ncbi:hypothetical protein M513_00294 [Trichuris suis]|uniref:Uncharacterized protein n=1 Tax=Trichuris suis TaxID=68888 RepID=A0A085MN05_9BILA|nr:hypothetical protein M513_00294 [Trichuris suis]
MIFEEKILVCAFACENVAKILFLQERLSVKRSFLRQINTEQQEFRCLLSPVASLITEQKKRMHSTFACCDEYFLKPSNILHCTNSQNAFLHSKPTTPPTCTQSRHLSPLEQAALFCRQVYGSHLDVIIDTVAEV